MLRLSIGGIYKEVIVTDRAGFEVLRMMEIGENMRAVCRRFVQQGMSAEQIAVRMDIPVKDVRALLR